MSVEKLNLIIDLWSLAIILYCTVGIFRSWLEVRWYGKARKLLREIEQLHKIGAIHEHEALDLLAMLIEPSKNSVRAVQAEIRKVLV